MGRASFVFLGANGILVSVLQRRKQTWFVVARKGLRLLSKTYRFRELTSRERFDVG